MEIASARAIGKSVLLMVATTIVFTSQGRSELPRPIPEAPPQTSTANADQTHHDAPVTSNQELLWRLITHPVSLGVALVAVFILFVALRMAGYDILEPVLHKFHLSTVPPFLDIAGKWDYKCTPIDAKFREWGGTAIIHEEATRYGITWKLFGQRKWETHTNDAGEQVRRDLQTPFPWETNWGVITPEPAVRFGYRITTVEGIIEGYAYCDVDKAKGAPTRMIGKFYQFSPFQPTHGRAEFTRRSDIDGSG